MNDHPQSPAASPKSKIPRILGIAGCVLLATIAAGIYWFLTTFDRTLRNYAALCAGEEKALYGRVREVTLEEFPNAAYFYSDNTPIPAKVERGFTINVIEPPEFHSRPQNSVYGFRCGGMLYLVLHKWVNFSSGICVPVENGAKPPEDHFIDYSDIPNSQWKIWKNDPQKDEKASAR